MRQRGRVAISLRTPDQLGLRIRKARMELGLSLAAVAGSDFSRAFLNQVELAQARPSMRTLQIIAERLHRPIEYFLQDPRDSLGALEFSLAEAGTRLRQGDAARAEALMRELIDRPQVPAHTRVRAQLVLADALLRLRRGEEAAAVLGPAIAVAEGAAWGPLAVDLYDRMGSAHYLLRHPHEAGRWWDRALTAYEDLGLTDPLLRARILGHRANLHYVAGEPQEAISGYQSAIAAAGHVLDMQALGGLFEGLALSFMKTGELDRALAYAQRSLRLFETMQDVRMTAQLRNNMAEILLEQGRPQAAEELFLEGANQLRHVGDQDVLPHLLAGAAEAALDMHRLGEAEQRVSEVLRAAPLSRDPLARLTSHRVAGRIMTALERYADARGHFEAALQVAAEVESPLARSRIAYDYARCLEAAGDGAGALAWYREAYDTRRSIGLS